MKKILSVLFFILLLLISAVLLLSACDSKGSDTDNNEANQNPSNNNDGVFTPSTDFIFSAITDDTISIQSYTGSSRNIVIPPKILDKTIVEIAPLAFSNCQELETISIPSTIKAVYGKTFENCENLKYNEYNNALYLGNSENKYFALIKAKFEDIKSCEINSETKIISSDAFENCISLESINIPANITGIGYNAFFNCPNLNEVTFAKESKIEVIDSGVFAFCTKLKKIDLPNTITSIGDSAFSACSSLEIINMPDLVTKIGKSAFMSCSSLKGIRIPKSVSSISDYTFWESGLVEITIHDNITEIGMAAFASCSNLKKVNLSDESKLTQIYSHAFQACTSLESFTAPSILTSIGDDAFLYCYRLLDIYNLSSIKIEKEAISNGYIGYYALNINTSVASKDNWKKIGDYIFYEYGNTTYLAGYNGNDKSLILPTLSNEKTYVINKYAFFMNANIISITIPACVSSIEKSAFEGCFMLTEVYNFSNIDMVKGSKSNGGIGFYALDIYSSQSTGNKYKEIDDYTFYEDGDALYLIKYNGSSTKLILPEIPNKHYIIRQYAFFNNKKITEVTIPKSVKSIEHAAFANCTMLNSVKFLQGSELKSIGEYAFYRCNISKIIIPQSVEYIEKNVFSIYIRDNSLLNGIKYIATIALPNSIDISFEDSTTWYMTENQSDMKSKTGGIAINVDDADSNENLFQKDNNNYYFYKL